MMAHKRGANTIEFLVVISIIAISIAMIIPPLKRAFNGDTSNSANNTKNQAQLETSYTNEKINNGRSCGCSNCHCDNNCKCAGKVVK